MVANVDSSDYICRRVDVKVRLSLEIEGSRRADYMIWPLPGPGHVTCSRAVTLSLSLGADLLGCQSQYKRKDERETKNETIILHTQLYEPISPTTDRYSSMATFRQIRRTGKIHLHLTYSEGGKNPCRRHLYRAEIQTMSPPVRTDPVWGRAQSSPVQTEGWTGLDHRLPVLDWMGLVWTSPHTLTILTLFHSQVSLKT